MKTSTLILLLVALVPTNLPAEGKHLFILSGQSNMAGLDPNASFTPAVENAFGKDKVTVVRNAQSGAPIRSWVRDYEFPDKRDINDKEKKHIGKKYADLLNEYVDDLTGNSCHLSLSLAVGEMRDLVDELLEERSK